MCLHLWLPNRCHLLLNLCHRVWPGGLNMARTIGDAEAGEAVTAEPEASWLHSGGSRAAQALSRPCGGCAWCGGRWDACEPRGWAALAVHPLASKASS